MPVHGDPLTSRRLTVDDRAAGSNFASYGTGTTSEILGRIAEQAVVRSRAVACGIVVEGADGKLVATGGFGFPISPESIRIWTAAGITLDELPSALPVLAGTPIFIDDNRRQWEAHPRLGPFAETIAELSWSSSVYFPLARDGRTFGVLNAYLPPEVDAPTPAEVSVWSGLADQASVVVTNGQLAASMERTRLARELHDSVSQTLFSISMHARAAELGLAAQPAGASPQLRQSIREIVELSEGARAEMRALIFELRPEALVQEGLVSALEKQTAALGSREGLTVTLEAPETPVGLSAGMEEQLYRAAMEAVNNAVKHARASTISVRLSADEAGLELTVTDDGCGFDPEQIEAGHLGVSTMTSRVQAVGGRIDVSSAPGAGTCVRLTIDDFMSR